LQTPRDYCLYSFTNDGWHRQLFHTNFQIVGMRRLIDFFRVRLSRTTNHRPGVSIPTRPAAINQSQRSRH
jgi:hypothetical protein